MNVEMIIGIAGAFGGLEALKWLANLRSSRRKGAAEAAGTVEEVVAKRVKTYEESITFLQGQLQEKERQFAELTEKYQESMQRGLTLTRQLGEMKLKYGTTRCDNRECENRKPPFRWLKKTAAGVAMLTLGVMGCGCSKKVYIPVETVRVERDSTLHTVARVDTIMRCDSIYIGVRGDTIIKEAWRIRERVTLKHDTLYIAKSDTVVRPQIVEVEKKRGTGRKLWYYLRVPLLLALTLWSLRRRR